MRELETIVSKARLREMDVRIGSGVIVWWFEEESRVPGCEAAFRGTPRASLRALGYDKHRALSCGAATDELEIALRM
jgi:hypothetical protein